MRKRCMMCDDDAGAFVPGELVRVDRQHGEAMHDACYFVECLRARREGRNSDAAWMGQRFQAVRFGVA